jgi:hypothetical protein
VNLKNFCGGLEILRPYFNDPNGYHIGAEHDQFFVFATDMPVSAEDVATLRALGWFQPEVDEDDDGNQQYEPGEGWSAFT